MIHAGLVIDIEDNFLYVLYRAQVYGLPMFDDYEDFDKGQWVSLIKKGHKIVRAEDDKRLEVLNRWNPRVEDDDLLVDVNVLKRDYDAYPIRKKKTEDDEEEPSIWCLELHDIHDLEDEFADVDIPVGTFYQCTVSLSINTDDYCLENGTNILEPEGFNKFLVKISHISSRDLQIHTVKAPWCHPYRTDLPPFQSAAVQLGKWERNKMRTGIIARKIMQKDGKVRYFLWSKSTGALPVIVIGNRPMGGKTDVLEVGRVYYFQTQFVRDEICAVRLLRTDTSIPSTIHTSKSKRRTTDDIVVEVPFDIPKMEGRSRLQQNHPFFGQLCVERINVLRKITEGEKRLAETGEQTANFNFIFTFFEKEESSNSSCWILQIEQLQETLESTRKLW